MRIAYVVTYPPWAKSSGGQIRSFYAVQALCERHEVDVYVSTCARTRTDAPLLLKVYQFRSDSSFRAWRHCIGGRLPMPIVRYVSSELKRTLQSNASAYDCVIIDHLANSYVGMLGGKVKTVLLAHNVEYALWFARADHCRSRVAKEACRLVACQMLGYERSQMAERDLVAFVSKIDQSILGRWAKRSIVFENGVDTGDRRYLADIPSIPRLLFPGSLEYFANRDAIRFFFETIFPGIQRAIPEVRLDVVGYCRSDPTRLVPPRFRSSVQIHANVPDMEPYYSSSRAVVVPLRIGSGSRLKILEAMAFGRPVIATAKAAEGLELREDEHFLCADTPQRYCEQVVRILTDNALVDRLRISARDHVASRYDWKFVTKPWVDSIESL